MCDIINMYLKGVMNKMSDDIRIVIIKENGNIVTIFSSENYVSDNVTELTMENYSEKIDKYYEQIKNKVYKDDDYGDKHLVYLKDYLKSNFKEEFESIKMDPSKISDDILLYFILSEFNNVVFVNSSEHINIAVLPYSGINSNQLYSMKLVSNKFDDSIRWSFADNMHFEIIKDRDGKKFRVLEVGETREGKMSDILKDYECNLERKVVK